MHRVEDYFDELYRRDDPYGYRDRWYEERKRALLLAALTKRRYATGWEFGCSNGELSAALATRCDTLLATDLSPRAVVLATQRTAGLGNVTVVRAAHPADWPSGKFELIVFSEVGYFLTPTELVDCARRLRASLAPTGLLVACHWQRAFSEARTVPAEVHRLLQATLALPQLFHYGDGDILLGGWAFDRASVASREGLV